MCGVRPSVRKKRLLFFSLFFCALSTSRPHLANDEGSEKALKKSIWKVGLIKKKSVNFTDYYFYNSQWVKRVQELTLGFQKKILLSKPIRARLVEHSKPATIQKQPKRTLRPTSLLFGKISK